MSFNPNHLLNDPAAWLAHPGLNQGGLMTGLDNRAPEPAPAPPPPFDKGLYLNAYSRLGMLGIDNVADLGCGAGNFVSVMVAKGMRPDMYVGIDNHHQRISAAKAAYPGWKFIYGDMREARVRAEYERYGAFLMLNLVDTLEDDLEFLAEMPPGKPLLFSLPKMEMEGSRRFMTESNEIRDRYSAVVQIKAVGRYYNSNTQQGWSLALASRW